MSRPFSSAASLKFDPSSPDWPDRDRFVLSNGHGSMLLYALLYLTGYPDIDIDEIRNFRQLGSRTAGHPEYGVAAGIETTTGPLGQGLANAVGMALAERSMAARFGSELVDHHTYVVCGDGCLMEGISQEAISLAGHLRLDRLIVLYDSNDISIDGPTSLAFSDDARARFESAGWHTQRVDGHDPEAVAAAIAAAKAEPRPSMIECRTVIGFGAPTKAEPPRAMARPSARTRSRAPARAGLAPCALHGAGPDPRGLAHRRRAGTGRTSGLGGAPCRARRGPPWRLRRRRGGRSASRPLAGARGAEAKLRR